MKKTFASLLLLNSIQLFSQEMITPFENTKRLQTTTYFDCIDYYKKLDAAFGTISIKIFGNTNAGCIWLCTAKTALLTRNSGINKTKWYYSLITAYIPANQMVLTLP